MRRLTAVLMAAAMALASFNVLACSGDKVKDGKGEMSTPAKPKA